MSRYDDIINLPHHVSKKHPPMPIEERAAQFSPYAALTGHGDAVKEHARLTDERIRLEEDELCILDMRLNALLEHIAEQPELTVTYFLPDPRKSGGAYVEKTGRLKRIDPVRRCLVFTDGTTISLDDVYGLEGPLFGAAYADHDE